MKLFMLFLGIASVEEMVRWEIQQLHKLFACYCKATNAEKIIRGIVKEFRQIFLLGSLNLNFWSRSDLMQHSQILGKLVIEKLDHQVDPLFGEVTHKITTVDGLTTLDVDVQCFQNIADVMVKFRKRKFSQSPLSCFL